MNTEIKNIKEKVKCGYLRAGKLIVITGFGSLEEEIEYHQGNQILIECMHPKLHMFGCLVNDGKKCSYISLEANDAVDKRDDYIPF